MNKRILNQSEISIYNPQRMSDEVVERIFVVRTKELQYFLDKISDEKESSIPQHYLIVASRGMGKSTLLKRIEVALRNTELNERYIPLLLPEEQYNLKNIGEFWLNCLDALADTLEQIGMKELVVKLDERIEIIRHKKTDQNNSKLALEELLNTCRELNKRPVLLIDNLNLIFDRLPKEDHHQLRAELMRNNAPIVIGASSSIIEETSDYQAPFYDAFQFYSLRKLSFDELLQVIQNLAALTGEQNQLANIHANSPRLKSIFHLTGGNPRTASMLFRLIARGFAQNIKDDLDGLLDEITPLYKARFEELSQQNQIIIDAIALNWDPISIEALRIETRFANQQLSPQLKRLFEAGWINRIKTKRVKGDLYEISERFFNIWFLMRRSSRRKKREIYCLARFLEIFLGEELETIADVRIRDKAESLDLVYIDLALAESIRNPEKKKYLRDRGKSIITKLAESDPTIKYQFDLANEESAAFLNQSQNKSKKVNEQWFQRFVSLLENRRLIDADVLLKEVDNGTKNETILYANGLLNHALGNYQLAIENYLEALSFKTNNSDIWFRVGYLYQFHFKQYEDSEYAYKKALEISPEDPNTWCNLGVLYQANLNRLEDAESAYKKSLEIQPYHSIAWNNLGRLYHINLYRFQDAEHCFKQAIDIKPDYANAWLNLGDLYTGHFSRFKEAENAYKRTIELEPNNVKAWNDLGILFQLHLKQFKDSLEAYSRALELDPNSAVIWQNMGILQHENLGNYLDAEKAYNKVLELEPTNYSVTIRLGNLYQDYLKKYTESEYCYLKCINAGQVTNIARHNLIFLYRDKLGKIQEAKSIFNELTLQEELEDSYWLNSSLFGFYEQNFGNARESLEKALKAILHGFKQHTIDDWWRFAAVVSQLGHQSIVLNEIETLNITPELAPYYHAIKAMKEKDRQDYINSIASEMREPVGQIIEKIQNQMS